jgi:hypothetical protein
LSIEAAVEMMSYVTIKVDGALPPNADTAFPMPADLVDHLKQHYFVEWFGGVIVGFR